MSTHLKRLVILSTLLLMVLGNRGACAHGGEAHGDEAQSPPPDLALAARASAQSEDFELVAVLEELKPQGKRLLLFLDRFATNEPVLGAKIEIETAGQSLAAQEISPGVYATAFGALANVVAGTKLPLTMTIEAGDSTDLLATTLEIPSPSDGVAANIHEGGEIANWLPAAVIGLAAITVLIVRRRSQTRGAK